MLKTNNYIENKNIILTGASSGIGFSVLKKLSSYKTNVFTFSRNLAKLNKAINNINSPVANIFSDTVDLQYPGALNKYFNSVFVAEDRSVDILINNAGFFSASKFIDTTFDDYEKIININLRGVFLLTQLAISGMLKKKSGLIINIASVTANKAFPNCSIYSASKAGMLAMMRSLREEVRKSGIKIINISPGATATNIWNEQVLAQNGYLMSTPEDIANVIISSVELCSLTSTLVEEIVVRPQNGDF